MALTYTTDFAGKVGGVNTSIISGTLTVGAGDYITVVYIVGESSDVDAETVSNNGSAITWTQRLDSGAPGGTPRAVVYSGVAGATPPTTVTVTATSGLDLNTSAGVFTIAHNGENVTTPLPAGNLFSGNSTTDASQSITPTSVGSCLWFVAIDSNFTNTFAPIADCTEVYDNTQAVSYTTVLVRPTTQPRTTVTAFTIGETDTSGNVAWVAFEVQSEPSGSTGNLAWIRA